MRIRRIIVCTAAVLCVIQLGGCGGSSSSDGYLSLPFSATAKLSIGTSEYTVSLSRGGADMVSLRVELPEALAGLTLDQGGGTAVSFGDMEYGSESAGTVPAVLAAAFSPEASQIRRDGETTVYGFEYGGAEGFVYLDSFSSAPTLLEYGDMSMEFTEFLREG